MLEDLRKFVTGHIYLQVVVIWINAFTDFNDGAVEVHSLGDSTVIFVQICFVRLGVSVRGRKQLLLLKQRMSDAFFTLGKVLAMEIVLEHHLTPHRLINNFLRSSNLKCSKQTSVSAVITSSLPLFQRIAWIHFFPLEANGGRFLSFLVAFRNTTTRRHGETEQTTSTTKQNFSGDALSKKTKKHTHTKA